MAGNSSPSVALGVRVPGPLYEAIRLAAAERGVSVSMWVRDQLATSIWLAGVDSAPEVIYGGIKHALGDLLDDARGAREGVEEVLALLEAPGRLGRDGAEERDVSALRDDPAQRDDPVPRDVSVPRDDPVPDVHELITRYKGVEVTRWTLLWLECRHARYKAIDALYGSVVGKEHHHS